MRCRQFQVAVLGPLDDDVVGARERGPLSENGQRCHVGLVQEDWRAGTVGRRTAAGGHGNSGTTHAILRSDETISASCDSHSAFRIGLGSVAEFCWKYFREAQPMTTSLNGCVFKNSRCWIFKRAADLFAECSAVELALPVASASRTSSTCPGRCCSVINKLLESTGRTTWSSTSQPRKLHARKVCNISTTSCAWRAPRSCPAAPSTCCWRNARARTTWSTRSR